MYTTSEVGAETNMLNCYVIVRGEGGEEKEICETKVLLLCRCSMKGDAESVLLAFLEYMQWVPPSDAADDTLGCVCLRWAAKDGAEDESETSTALEADDCAVAGGNGLKQFPF